MEIQQAQETFYIITDIIEPEEEKLELFTYEDAVAILQEKQKDDPFIKLLEVREF